mmetsp:Transcript_29690/g.91091  ORF Transcript_29690/g.91091 Transcript_29690/m.91091 type:complete len:1608 (-) Transcript_29690:1837-6660(-)
MELSSLPESPAPHEGSTQTTDEPHKYHDDGQQQVLGRRHENSGAQDEHGRAASARDVAQQPTDSHWRRAHTLIYARRLAHTTAAHMHLTTSKREPSAVQGISNGELVGDEAGLGERTQRERKTSRWGGTTQCGCAIPVFALVVWPSFSRELEWEYFFYSIAASRGSIARVCGALAVQAVGEVVYLSINAAADAAGPTQVAAGSPHAILFFFGRLLFAAAASGIAALFAYCGRAGLKSHPRLHSVVVLMLLFVDGVMMSAADTTEGSSSHTVLLVLLHIVGYAVLVPHLQARHVTFTFWLLLGCRLALAKFWRVRNTLIYSTMIHGIVVNLVGMTVACLAESQNRANFRSSRVLLEEEGVKVALRDGVHRLLLNTLPAPIVRDIASGLTQVAHRYDEVTVLQADMVGFTNLSAQRSAEYVLGLLSDLFDKFDALTEEHKTHKVKTIGDAYVVCCGAFGEAPNAAEAARRVTAMGLSMLEEVQAAAQERGVDIGIRVGVHTGTAIGGIIGTVRFHFDMWGRAMLGAVKMEETGIKGRVHLSDATAVLLAQVPRLSRQAPPFCSFASLNSRSASVSTSSPARPTMLEPARSSYQKTSSESSNSAAAAKGLEADAVSSSSGGALANGAADHGTDGWLRGGCFDLTPALVMDAEFRQKFKIERTYFASLPLGAAAVGPARGSAAGGLVRRGGLSTTGGIPNGGIPTTAAAASRTNRRVSWPVRGSTERGSCGSYDDESSKRRAAGARKSSEGAGGCDRHCGRSVVLNIQPNADEGNGGEHMEGDLRGATGALPPLVKTAVPRVRLSSESFMRPFRDADPPNRRLSRFLSLQTGEPDSVGDPILATMDDLFAPHPPANLTPACRRRTSPGYAAGEASPTTSPSRCAAPPLATRARSLSARSAAAGILGRRLTESGYVSQQDSDSSTEEDQARAPHQRHGHLSREAQSSRDRPSGAGPSSSWLSESAEALLARARQIMSVITNAATLEDAMRPVVNVGPVVVASSPPPSPPSTGATARRDIAPGSSGASRATTADGASQAPSAPRHSAADAIAAEVPFRAATIRASAPCHAPPLAEHGLVCEVAPDAAGRLAPPPGRRTTAAKSTASSAASCGASFPLSFLGFPATSHNRGPDTSAWNQPGSSQGADTETPRNAMSSVASSAPGLIGGISAGSLRGQSAVSAASARGQSAVSASVGTHARLPAKTRLDSSEIHEHGCFVDETNFFVKVPRHDTSTLRRGWGGSGLGLGSARGLAMSLSATADSVPLSTGGGRGGGNEGFGDPGAGGGGPSGPIGGAVEDARRSSAVTLADVSAHLGGARRVNDAHTRTFLMRYMLLLLLWVTVYGVADATHFSVRWMGLTQIWPLPLVRYCFLVPALLVLRTWLVSARTPSAIGNSFAAGALLVLPAIAMGFVVTHVGLDVRECDDPYKIVACAGRLQGASDADASDVLAQLGFAPPPPSGEFTQGNCTIVGSILGKFNPEETRVSVPPPPPPPSGFVQGDALAFYCGEVELGSNITLCQGFPFEYMTELAVWHIFFHYALTHLPIFLLGAVSAVVSVAVVVLTSKEADSFWHDQLHSGVEPQQPGLDDFVVFELTRMTVMLLFAHIVGALHHW